MKIIHTSDWHLGQLFHGRDRSNEHQRFLDWLIDTLVEKEPDALLIAGDIFDHANPSGPSQKQFYQFLAEVKRKCPDLDIVIIAGNHDSAGRLEAPQSLLAEFGVHVVGQLQSHADPRAALIPLRTSDDKVAAWCIGIPYLRPGDVPRDEDERLNYPAGIAATYRRHLDAALAEREPDQAVIAMGHLHAQGGRTSEDSERRLVVGGEEAVDCGIFGDELAYVALGHLHLAQRVGDREHIRYCGSPLPLSFTEISYPHQILEITLAGAELSSVESIPVPRPVEMLRIPGKPEPLDKTIEALNALEPGESEPGLEPWLEVQVLLEGPEPGLRQKIEEALEDKAVRLVKISPTRHRPEKPASDQESADSLELKQATPEELFRRQYEEQYGQAPDTELTRLFKEIEDQAFQGEQA